MTPQEALQQITDAFYSGDSDRVACYAIGRILGEAGYGPHARPKADERTGGDPGTFAPNGNVHHDGQWWQAYRADSGRVYRKTATGRWVPQKDPIGFRPW